MNTWDMYMLYSSLFLQQHYDVRWKSLFVVGCYWLLFVDGCCLSLVIVCLLSSPYSCVVLPNVFGPRTMVAPIVKFKDRESGGSLPLTISITGFWTLPYYNLVEDLLLGRLLLLDSQTVLYVDGT